MTIHRCAVCQGVRPADMDVCLVCSLVVQLATTGVPRPEREVRFSPPRRWRFDLAWLDSKLAVEADGATWAHGRHSRGSGYERDCEKLAEAAILGWRVIRCTRQMIESGQAAGLIVRALVPERSLL